MAMVDYFDHRHNLLQLINFAYPNAYKLLAGSSSSARVQLFLGINRNLVARLKAVKLLRRNISNRENGFL